MKRDLGKADEIFDVPAINFFTSGNDYFGSSGSKFRYRISHTDETIVVRYGTRISATKNAPLPIKKRISR